MPAFLPRVQVGITESTDTSLDPAAVEACVRDELNVTAPRAMAVTEPLRVDIDNLPADFPSSVSVPNINFDETAGKHTVPVCSVLYINRDDFEEEGSKGFKRLTPTQSVGLKYLNMSTVDSTSDCVAWVRICRVVFAIFCF